jgi:LuxR family maltose regulon positive regulatory protein
MVMLLIAILYHRQKSPRWYDYFTEAMKRAENFRYIRVIADEGAAILPLFNDLEPEEKKEFNPSWYERVEEAVREMAFHYPNYLQETKEKEISLTKAEKKVMTSLCQGLNSEEICDQLHITYSGLKYHKRNIYRKMGVHTIQEAISMAKTMGLDK